MSNSVPASDRFHAAIKSGAKQRALIYFFDDNLYLTNDDITSSGLHYENYFNTEEDIFIGGTPSATLSFSLFNENHRLDSIKFGRFKASIAAMVAVKEHYRVGNVSVDYEGDTLSGHNEYPYFRSNGESVAEQPSFPIHSIIVCDGLVYCVGLSGQLIVYKKESTLSRGAWGTVSRHTWSQISDITWQDVLSLVVPGGAYEEYIDGSIDEIMIPSVIRYAERNIGIVVINDKTVEDYLPNGFAETYEYVDLGVFYANKPARVKTNIVSVDGYDAMVKFDVSTENMPIAFPITLKNLLNNVCSFVGVKHKVSSFINEDVTIDENSDIFQNSTARDVIGYIAEAACCVARIDYDGVLTFSWWEDSDLVLDESDYSSFVPNEYSVKPIDRLQIRSSENDIGILIGQGTNGYIIQENPFLVFSAHDEGIVRANPIYERLSDLLPYVPGTVKWFADWSYRPGDFITLISDGIAYRYPVFGYSLDWSGSAIASLESTGNEYREVMDAQHRESFAVGRKMLEIEKTIDGIRIIASEAKTESGSAYEKAASVELSVSGLNTRISSVETSQEETVEKVSQLNQTVDGFDTRISSVETSQGQTTEKVSQLTQTVNGFDSRVSSIEGEQDKLESAVSQNASAINAKVSKGSVISEINLSTESAKIKAPKIEFDGAVITNGTLETGNWKFDQSGSNYSNGNQGINMTVMSGDFVGGGSGTRAFFGSSGMDVQYGSDYNRNTYLRSGKVIVISQNPEDMSQYATAEYTRSATGQMTFVCGESKGDANPNEDPQNGASGNLGYDGQYWDYAFIRVLRAKSYPGSSSRAIKQDIEELPEMGDILDRLAPVSFAYKSDPTKPRYGLIYEDTKKVMPVICFDDGKGDPGIVYTDLIAPMLKEIQSLRARVKALEERA